ncbi:hypothetical protein P152DRAFT_476040 [Eremomyces bilateralis CBS 781.70]|uniref:Uncharacterized protein n=1 Tax=Eremomyces bilateralis CBS 781.70 TaxID=1392243 RepID=A0A6G1FVQ5_9PEZI|nr:uncharacterized protein P152DRAFT_476040 [Eremomyces bilateralis CBS 781.70]KAF1809907.1 hypothetical protein P152DRAFT_476040 [Eremomyces bilateralis CBS 781.70]
MTPQTANESILQRLEQEPIEGTYMAIPHIRAKISQLDDEHEYEPFASIHGNEVWSSIVARYLVAMDCHLIPPLCRWPGNPGLYMPVTWWYMYRKETGVTHWLVFDYEYIKSPVQAVHWEEKEELLRTIISSKAEDDYLASVKFAMACCGREVRFYEWNRESWTLDPLADGGPFRVDRECQSVTKILRQLGKE